MLRLKKQDPLILYLIIGHSMRVSWHSCVDFSIWDLRRLTRIQLMTYQGRACFNPSMLCAMHFKSYWEHCAESPFHIFRMSATINVLMNWDPCWINKIPGWISNYIDLKLSSHKMLARYSFCVQHDDILGMRVYRLEKGEMGAEVDRRTRRLTCMRVLNACGGEIDRCSLE